MTWSGMRVAGLATSRQEVGRGTGRPRRLSKQRRGARRARGLTALLTSSTMVGSTLVPVTIVAAGAAAIATVGVWRAQPAKASVSGTVLILSTSVNGGSSSMEAQQATALGLTVTVDTPSTWDALTINQFKGYSAIIIGDPSTSSCSSTVPSDALSTAATWGAAVSGNVSVLGTAPVLGGGTTLVNDAIAYAASGSGTGLYVSLNCEYSSSAAGTAVPLLAGVGGGGWAVSGQAASCPNAGTVNTWQSVADTGFNGIKASNLGSWSSPACSVQETFTGWPGGLGGLAYDAAATPALFTRSDGATAGQAYIISGPVSTAALAPSTGGQVPPAAVSGGGNIAAPGVMHAMLADPVDTASGAFTESATDVTIGTYGPSLSFSRSYSSVLAQQESVAGSALPPGAPGSLGYGWTDNWDTWLRSGQAAPGDIFTTGGLATSVNDGGLATAVPLNWPGGVYQNGGDVYIPDASANRVLEIPGTSKTQWGVSMTAGHAYTVFGSPTGTSGTSGNGVSPANSRLSKPCAVTMDSAGDLFIADSGNNRILEVPAAGGTFYNITMTMGKVYTIAGSVNGTAGSSGNGGVAKSALLDYPTQVITNGSGSQLALYIADAVNNRVQELYETTGGNTWGQSMTAGDIYTVAGSASGTAGDSGDGGLAKNALLSYPNGVGMSSAGDLYIADTNNNQIREVAKVTGAQWNNGSMTANDIYTVAGSSAGTAGISANGTVNTSTKLNSPTGVSVNNGGQLYISDTNNNRVAELARTAHSEFSISMTANDIYDVAGSVSGTKGHSGDGGAGPSALMNAPWGATTLDGSGNLIVVDAYNLEARKISGTTGTITDYAGGVGSFYQDGNGGPAVSAGLWDPYGVASDGHGDIFVADLGGNRIQELATWSHTQFGIPMTAGDVYTVAGSAAGYPGVTGDGGAATSGFLNSPTGVALDNAGNLYVADFGNNRIQKVNTSGTMSTLAGSATGTSGNSGQGGPATSALLNGPYAVASDGVGDVFIADTHGDQVQEVPSSSGTNYAISMTAGDLYTIAGATNGNQGTTGDGGPGTSALLNAPEGVAVDGNGNVYIGDWGNNRVQEVAAHAHSQWGTSMSTGYIYTVAGSAAGTSGLSGDGGPATSARLNAPGQIAADSSGDLYITDAANNRIQEVAAGSGNQWGQPMVGGDIYTIAGSPTGAAGSTGDGGSANAALLSQPVGIGADPEGDLFITDYTNNHLREITNTASSVLGTSPAAGSTWSTSGVTITQTDGSQVTFFPTSSGSCVAPYVAAGSGGYCALPMYVGATLSYNSGAGTFTYVPSPGQTYVYGSNGALESVVDAAGDTLNISYGTPLPGSGNCPSWAVSCNTITSASGRTLTIGYNSAGLVDVMEDSMGRQWDYTHVGGDLSQVTDPRGEITTFTYDTSNPAIALTGDILTVTSPNAQVGGPDAGDSTVNVYDAQGRVTQQTDPMGFVTSFNYCVNAVTGNCMNTSTGTGFTTVTDPDGNTTVEEYTQGSLAAQSDWTGGTALTSEQDYAPSQVGAATQQPTATADGNGNVTNITYSNGNPTVIAAPDGVDPQPTQTTQAYTNLNLPDCSSTVTAASTCQTAGGPTPVAPGGVITPPSSAPPRGETWTLYDTDGNELYTTTGVYPPGSNTVSYSQTTYQLFKNNSITLSGNSISCTTQPPSQSLPCATINADGVVTQLGYNSSGDLNSSSTPDGNGTEVAKTTYTYNGDGNQNSVISPDGNLTGATAANFDTVTVYGNSQLRNSVTQAGGTGATVTPRTTTFGYDPNGNQTTVQDARGYTTTTTYNADNQATLVQDPDGNQALTCFDGDGNVAQTVPPVGVAANNLTPAACPTSYPAGYSTRLASDATVYTMGVLGEKTQETTPLPAGQSGPPNYETTTYAYDGDGNLTQTTAPPTANGGPNQVTVNTYTSTGQLASVTTGSASTPLSTISYCHDPDGNKTAVVYGDGATPGTPLTCGTNSSYPYIVDPNSQAAAWQTTYSYDSLRELVSTTAPKTTAAPNGATAAETYDPAGNTLTRTDPNGVTTTWTYSPLNLQATVTYSGGSAHSVTYGYDADGSMTSMTDATGSSGYVNDPFGELTSATNGAGQVTGYGYNADGQVSSITYPLPTGATWAASHTVSYGYDNAGLPSTLTDFNGNQITVGSTADGETNSLTLAATGDILTTNFDNNGTPLTISLKNGSSTLQAFTYSDSPAGTILSESDTPSSSQSPAAYTYDTKGRVTSMTPGTGPTLNYGFDPSGNLTTTPTGATASYDKAGELTSATLGGTTTGYTYNADGQRLTAVQGTTTVASGAWNGAGQLTSYNDAAANMTAATYAGNGERATETTSSGTQSFVWDLVSRIPQQIMDSTNAYIFGSGLAPIEQVNLSTGAITYLVSDSLGSVRGAVGPTGSLLGVTAYDAWGNPENSGGLISTTPFGYAGGYTDSDGLIYLVNRYYDPATGQFISVDPAISQTTAPYGYASGNPVSLNDPTGLTSCWSRGHAYAYTYYLHWVFTIDIPACIIGVGAGLLTRSAILAFLNRILDWGILGWLAFFVGSFLASDIVEVVATVLMQIWAGMIAWYTVCVASPWADDDGIRATVTVVHTRKRIPLFYYPTFGCF